MDTQYKKQLANNAIKFSIEEIENNFINNSNGEIELEFQNIFNLSIIFGDEWLNKKIDLLEKRLQSDAGMTITQIMKIKGSALSTGGYMYSKSLEAMQLA